MSSWYSDSESDLRVDNDIVPANYVFSRHIIQCLRRFGVLGLQLGAVVVGHGSAAAAGPGAGPSDWVTVCCGQWVEESYTIQMSQEIKEVLPPGLGTSKLLRKLSRQTFQLAVLNRQS